ncbi:MAG TPA: LPS assembly lipoprotein LptE [Anaeromyxobacteraceae bacterium]|nr:LPS assembly lipoprotein LptE [Anaeromyxobacteraceae bacterium]
MALLAALSACGYSFTAAGRLTGGIASATVLPFENRSTEPELGAVLAGALREELAARGRLARGESQARIVGEVGVGVPSPAAPGGVSWRVTLDVRARLLDGDRVVAERTLKREADYPAGLDALETEGRRALALRKLAAACAREISSSLME